jgi:hypothetical protein
MKFLKWLFCSHQWKHYPTGGYDSKVQCEHCEHVKDEEPGAMASWQSQTSFEPRGAICAVFFSKRSAERVSGIPILKRTILIFSF